MILGKMKRINNMAEENKKEDLVNHPKHYADTCSLECIEAMLIAFGAEATFDFCVCNGFKYLWRYKNKNGEQDIEKANWYVNKAESIFNDYSPKQPTIFDASKYEKITILRELIVDRFIEYEATKEIKEKINEKIKVEEDDDEEFIL